MNNKPNRRPTLLYLIAASALLSACATKTKWHETAVQQRPIRTESRLVGVGLEPRVAVQGEEFVVDYTVHPYCSKAEALSRIAIDERKVTRLNGDGFALPLVFLAVGGAIVASSTLIEDKDLLAKLVLVPGAGFLAGGGVNGAIALSKVKKYTTIERRDRPLGDGGYRWSDDKTFKCDMPLGDAAAGLPAPSGGRLSLQFVERRENDFHYALGAAPNARLVGPEVGEAKAIVEACGAVNVVASLNVESRPRGTVTAPTPTFLTHFTSQPLLLAPTGTASASDNQLTSALARGLVASCLRDAREACVQRAHSAARPACETQCLSLSPASMTCTFGREDCEFVQGTNCSQKYNECLAQAGFAPNTTTNACINTCLGAAGSSACPPP
jgi:hypothetical protein